MFQAWKTSAILSLTFGLMALFLGFFALPIMAQNCPHVGDVNQDGDITPADALLAFQHFLQIADPPLDACQLDQANVDDPNGDEITPADARCIFRRYLRLPSCLDERDTTPPTIQFLSPTAGSVVSTTTPTFSIMFSDDGAGLDLASYQTMVNGVDVTRATTVTPTGATYTPAAPLPTGENEVTARIADLAGNMQSVTIRFTISVFQAVADCAPTSGALPLQVRFRSRGVFSGGSIERYRWDFEGNGEFDTDDAVARDFAFTFNQTGTFTAVLEITNNFGDVATDTCEIHVQGSLPIATANATPSNGETPLMVNLTCTGTDADGTIALYEWDFTGDGMFDFSSSTSGTTSHTYADSGTFTAFCRVTDNDGMIGEARTTTTVIRPGPPGSPSVEASANRTVGEAPLTVLFNGRARDDGRIVLWEWDFDGNGEFEFSSPTSPATAHQYTVGGIFAAALRATDDTGLSSIDTVEIVVNVAPTLSIANSTLEILPPDTIVNLTQVVAVTANVSSALSGFEPERAIDGDLNTSWFTARGDAANLGTTPFYEVIFPSAVTVTQIAMRGNRQFANAFDFFKGRFEVFDATDTVLLSQDVELPAPDRDVDLDIPEQAGVRRVRFTGLEDESDKPGFAELEIRGPAPPGSIGIRTTLSGTLPVSIVLKDQTGAIIRRLVEGDVRTAGSYTDVWDGNNDAGQLVRPGVYYTVVEYDFAGEVRTVDLTNATGGVRRSPPRTSLPSSFAPFAGQPLVIDFTLAQASEVTAFIGRFDVDTRLVTFLERVPFGRGTHRLTWNGDNADGQLIHPPPGDSFLFGIFSFTLPDNAVLVGGRTELSDLSVTPSIFDPSGHIDDQGTPERSALTFELSRGADVDLVVSDAETGATVARRLFTGMSSGRNTVHWDGRDDAGVFVAPGRYRLGVSALDSTGNRSMRLYALQRIYY